MRISVIIPAFNDGHVITQAIDSALQRDAADEIIVVDDGSTDDTAEVVRGVGNPLVRLVSQSNTGVAGARNAGAAAATGEVLVFLDADDVLVDGALATFRLAHATTQHHLVRTGALRDHLGDIPRFAEPSPFSYPRGAPLAGTFSVARALFTDAGGYDTDLRFGENSELLYRLIRLVGPQNVTYVQTPTVLTHRRPDRPADHYESARLAGVVRMLDKHGADLAKDRETLANHHGIASVLFAARHGHRPAARHAFAAARAQPMKLRHWGRLAKVTTSWLVARSEQPIAPHNSTVGLPPASERLDD